MNEEITIKGVTYQLTEPEFHFPPCTECAFGGSRIICALPEIMKIDAICCKMENLRKVWTKKTQ